MKGWRTVIFNVLSMVVPFLELSEIKDVMPDEYLVWYVLGVAVLNLLLRTITSTPMGHSK